MTDILKPELVWIDGRCYRVNDASSEITTFQEHDLYEDEVTYNNIEDEEDDFEVVMVDNSRFATNFHVSKHYIGSIIGKKGFIKNRIERDTKTDIKIPRHGQTGDVTIFGPTEASVKAARRRLDIIVMSSRMKQKSTHFISIPMNSDEIVKNFELFKEAVLKECSSSRGLEESIFIKAQKLHLTLGVMCLMDNEERVIVSKLLNEAKENIVMPLMKDKSPLKIRLKGLSYMNDDPKEIDVLYGQIQEEGNATGLIQVLTDVLVNYFNKAGFMNREFERQNVKLHVTFMNSKYRSRSSSYQESSDSRRLRQKETFDGSEVLSKFANYDFGVAELREIHLSQRHSIGPDGYYQSTHVISCTDE